MNEFRGRSVYALINVLPESLNKTLKTLSHNSEALHGAKKRTILVKQRLQCVFLLGLQAEERRTLQRIISLWHKAA